MLGLVAPFLTAELEYHHHEPFGAPSRPVRAAGLVTPHIGTRARLWPRLVRRLRRKTQTGSGEKSSSLSGDASSTIRRRSCTDHRHGRSHGGQTT
jgi:hypothetical protein